MSETDTEPGEVPDDELTEDTDGAPGEEECGPTGDDDDPPV